MKGSLRIFSAHKVLFAACILFCLSAANANDIATTKPIDSKVRPVPKKHSGVVMKAQKAPAGDLQAALKRQIWMAQHKIPVPMKWVRQTPTSTPLPRMSRNEERKSIRDGLQGFSHMPRSGVKSQQMSGRNALQVTPPRVPLQNMGKSRVEAIPVDPHSTDDGGVQEEKSGNPVVLLVLVAICAALTGTIAVLYVISKRAHRAVDLKPVRQEVRPRPFLQDSIIVTPDRKQLGRVETIQNDAIEQPDEVVELAQRFQRGQGEMQLMFDLQSHREDKTPVATMINTSLSARAKGNKKKFVKKAGPGRGEAELLVRLQKFHTSANHAQRML